MNKNNKYTFSWNKKQMDNYIKHELKNDYEQLEEKGTNNHKIIYWLLIILTALSLVCLFISMMYGCNLWTLIFLISYMLFSILLSLFIFINAFKLLNTKYNTYPININSHNILESLLAIISPLLLSIFSVFIDYLNDTKSPEINILIFVFAVLSLLLSILGITGSVRQQISSTISQDIIFFEVINMLIHLHEELVDRTKNYSKISDVYNEIKKFCKNTNNIQRDNKEISKFIDKEYNYNHKGIIYRIFHKI